MALNVVTDLGVNNLCGADVTPIVNAAIASPPSDALYFPAGEYRIDDTILNATGTKLYGDGSATVFRPNSNLDTVALASIGAELTGVRFNPLSPKTAGYFVKLSSFHTRLDDFFMDGAYCAIGIDGTCATIARGAIRNSSPNGVVIDVLSGFDVSIRDVLMDNEAHLQPTTGIRAWHTGDLTIEDCNIIHCGLDLQFCPGTNQVVSSVFVNNTFLDTALRAVSFNPSGNGSIVRCIFDQVWMSSHGHQGLYIDAPGSTTVDGIDLNMCHIFENGKALQADGIYVGPRVKNFNLGHSVIAGNSGSGLSVAAGAMGGRVLGNRFGPSHGFGPNLFPVWIGGGASTGWVVSNNSFAGNVNAAAIGLGAGNYVGANV